MKKKIVYTYEWWRADGTNNKIPAHHETTLMGYTERYMLNARKGSKTSGKLEFTYKDGQIKTTYVGEWKVEYEY